MGSITTSAPGKVVLCGEYAVLDGAPAIAMAVNRRATVTIATGSPAAVTSRGLAGVTDTKLLDCVCEALGIDRPEAAISLDTTAFADAASGKKLGIGSSAALAVALVRALAPGDASSGAVFELALAAHRSFQAGRGSGVDVAASAAGGLLAFVMGDPPEALSWPANLEFAFLWSGVSASTASKLERLRQQTILASRDALCEASIAMSARWRAGDASALIDGYRDYVAALVAFDVDHHLGIFDAGHDELARYNSQTDVVYKPCGAGGGDIGIVLGTDPDDVSRFVQRALLRGFRRLDIAPDAEGVCMTPNYP